MDDMDSSFFLLRMLAGPIFVIAAIMLTFTVVAPVLLYVIARWRAHREPINDGQIGLKFALHYFAVSAFQLVLFGVALLLWTMISPGPSEAKSIPYRLSLGMVVPAGIVLGAHLVALKRTNDDVFHNVRRLFGGFNLLITGLVGFMGLVMGFQALFMKGSSGGVGHAAASVVIVYGTAWVTLAWRFSNLVTGEGTGSMGHGLGAPPHVMPPPSPPYPPVAAQGGGGGNPLPPLGGGSYPPIDQR